MSFRVGPAACVLAVLSGLSACKLFETTCGEDDRSCLGGGLVRSGEACVRSGNCATGMECRDGLCAYTGQSERGDKCVVSAECATGFYCSHELRCTALANPTHPAGGACGDSADCARGLVCDLEWSSVFDRGPYEALSDTCRSTMSRLDTPSRCALPTTCVKRGDGDFGTSCDKHSDCLPGLYCVASPLEDTKATTCLGGVVLPRELLSLPSWEGVKCARDSLEPVAYFEVPGAHDEGHDFYRLPFPNDIRRVNGRIDLEEHPRPPASVGVPVSERVIEAAAAQDGFATNPVVFFRFSVPIESGNLSPSTLRLVDITPESPEYNAIASVDSNSSERDSHYICPHWLALHRPVGSPLRPSTTYAAIVTRGLRAKDGEAFARSPDFEAMLASESPGSAALADGWQAYAPLRRWLDAPAADLSADDVLNAAVFTTLDPGALVSKLLAAARANGVPAPRELTLCTEGRESPCADAGGRGRCHEENPDFFEIQGKLRLPIFQDGVAPYEQPEAGGDIARTPRVEQSADVCFALAVPKRSPPAAGFPVLLYAHDTGGVFNEALAPGGLAGEMARGPAAAALLAIELPQHGSRRGDSQRPPEDLIVNLQNPAAMRGNMLQGAADLIGLGLFAEAGLSAQRSPTDAAIAFNPARIALYAQGQGASHAALALAHEDKIGAAVLAGLGGHFATLLRLREKPAAMAALLPQLLVDAKEEAGELMGGSVNPMLALIQSALESADPINFARDLYDAPAAGRDAFVVYGLRDRFVPEASLEAYAKAAGLRAVAPDLTMKWTDLKAPAQHNLSVGAQRRTVALRQYDPDSDPLDPEAIQDGHFVAQSTKTARADVVRFLNQALAGEVPQIGN